MIPKSFDKDITVWRKWKEEVTKYFDDEQEGMKRVMDAVSRVEKTVTEAVLQQECAWNPSLYDQLVKWKHLYRALEKLTEGEAQKVISTVAGETASKRRDSCISDLSQN